MRSEIAFGVQPGHSIGFGTAAVGSILPRNKHETIVTTAKGLHVIENWKVKTSYNVQLGASVFIACENLLVGVAAQNSELYVFPNRELGKPILSRFPTNQGPVFHVIYFSFNFYMPKTTLKINNSLTCRELLALELIGIEPTTY